MECDENVVQNKLFSYIFPIICRFRLKFNNRIYGILLKVFFDEKNIDCKKSENQNIHRNMSGFLEESLCTQLMERECTKRKNQVA